MGVPIHPVYLAAQDYLAAIDNLDLELRAVGIDAVPPEIRTYCATLLARGMHRALAVRHTLTTEAP